MDAPRQRPHPTSSVKITWDLHRVHINPPRPAVGLEVTSFSKDFEAIVHASPRLLSCAVYDVRDTTQSYLR